MPEQSSLVPHSTITAMIALCNEVIKEDTSGGISLAYVTAVQVRQNLIEICPICDPDNPA